MMQMIGPTDSKCSYLVLILYKEMLTDIFPHFELTFELHSPHSFIQKCLHSCGPNFFLDQENNFP
jgi:hypothetical protein